MHSASISIPDIKLIIWDLDETFWKGLLSENTLEVVPGNVSLVKALAALGIISSICSKNDSADVDKLLKELGIDDYFVFKSIDWSPKGKRIKKLIKDVGLRPVNCLFIDDNPQNLAEAKFYEPALLTSGPEIIESLREYVSTHKATDPDLSRLNNYKTLQKKQVAKSEASDNLSFLFNSNIRVQIHRDCLLHLERLHELVLRTNQLNFTKHRSTIEELKALIDDYSVNTGYVTAKDIFGDYGIVGFFAIKNHKAIHFLFSCRTIGQGIEQYVYSLLGYPDIDVIGEVVGTVKKTEAPQWINQKDNVPEQKLNKPHIKIILKGGCDLSSLSEYLQTDSIIEEFTYLAKERGQNMEHINHSTNYLQWHFLPKVAQQELVDECVFNDPSMFHTALYDDDVQIIFLSTMIEPNLGIYRRKKDGFLIAWGEQCYPLTDAQYWNLYINQEVFTAHNAFSKEWLERFRQEYEFIGCLSPDQIVNHARELIEKLNPKTKVCYILGSEIPYLRNSQKSYDERHLVYKAINERFRKLAKENNRILLLDVNDFIRGQEDFTNNINHFQRRIYFQMAKKANEIIASVTGKQLDSPSRLFLLRKSVIDIIGDTGFFQTKLWHILRKPYLRFK